MANLKLLGTLTAPNPRQGNFYFPPLQIPQIFCIAPQLVALATAERYTKSRGVQYVHCVMYSQTRGGTKTQNVCKKTLKFNEIKEKFAKVGGIIKQFSRNREESTETAKFGENFKFVVND